MPLLQLRVGLVSAAWSCSLEAVGYCSGVVSGLLAPGFVLGNLGVAQAAGASGAVAVVALALAHTQLFLWMCARHLHWSCRGLWASGARCTSGLIFVLKVVFGVCECGESPLRPGRWLQQSTCRVADVICAVHVDDVPGGT